MFNSKANKFVDQAEGQELLWSKLFLCNRTSPSLSSVSTECQPSTFRSSNKKTVLMFQAKQQCTPTRKSNGRRTEDANQKAGYADNIKILLFVCGCQKDPILLPSRPSSTTDSSTPLLSYGMDSHVACAAEDLPAVVCRRHLSSQPSSTSS